MTEPRPEHIERMLQTVIDEQRLIRADIRELKASSAAVLNLMGSFNRCLVTVEGRLERAEKRLEQVT